MAIDFLSPIDYNGVPSIAFAVPIASSDPVEGYTGGIYYNTTTNQLLYWNGTNWRPLGEEGAGGPPSGDAGGDLDGTYPDPQIRDGVIVNDVNASANIAQSKIANLTTDLAAKAANTVTISAGDGLTGGGNLTASRTLTVGAGTGITVNADDIEINRTVVNTWYDAAGTAATKVAKSGDTMTGALTLSGNPSAANHAANKTYVDTTTANRVAKAGDTMTGDLAMSGKKVTGLQGLGVGLLNDNDAAPIWYVDQHQVGITPMESAVARADAPITLSGLQTIDDVPIQAGDRVLVGYQHNGSTVDGDGVGNGIYIASTGAWTRATDANTEGSLQKGSYVYIEGGTLWGGTGFMVLIRDADLPWTPDVDDNYWMQLHNRPDLTVGDGLTQTGKRVDVSTTAGSGISITEDAVTIDRGTTDTWYDAAGSAANRVAKSGDTMTGALTLPGNPTAANHASNKGYVDTGLSSKANTSTSILAGNGLTGGGTLAATRTLTVAGGPTLSVTADQIDVVSAPKWTNARSITLTGDVTGTVGSVDGSSNISIATTIAGGDNLVKQYAAAVGAGTNVTVNHNLGTRDVTVEVYRATTPWDTVVVDTDRTTTNQITLKFATAVTAGQFRVVVQGK